MTQSSETAEPDRSCAYCGGEIGDQHLVWDVPEIRSLDDPERTGYAARYYFCSDECKDRGIHGETSHGDPDHIKITEDDDD